MERDGAQLVEEGARGKQPASRSFWSGFSLMDMPTRRGCSGTGSAPFNILLLLCFLACISLFSVTLIKLTQTLESMGKSTAQLTKFLDFMCNLCPVGWLRHNNTCYFFSDSSLAHRLAREACENLDAHLLFIDSQQELNFLTQNTKPKGYWIDLTDAGSEGVWHWGMGNP